jgi:inorganic pyrophosphatase
MTDIIEYTVFSGKRFEATWQSEGELPPRNQVTQASAVCFTSDDQIVMISGDGIAWNIPGGHPEEGESPDDALSREVWEEACCEIIEHALLGYQHVRDLTDDSVHFQLRYFCRVDVEPFDPKHEITHRKIISPGDFLQTLEYGHSPIAKEVFRLSMEANARQKSKKRGSAGNSDTADVDMPPFRKGRPMDFWTRCDRLLADHEIVIDMPKGTRHPRYPEIVYPLDYGYLKDTTGGDGHEIDVWRGSLDGAELTAVICTVDSLKDDAEVKLIVGCADEETQYVCRIYNEHEHMSGIVVLRGTS